MELYDGYAFGENFQTYKIKVVNRKSGEVLDQSTFQGVNEILDSYPLTSQEVNTLLLESSLTVWDLNYKVLK